MIAVCCFTSSGRGRPFSSSLMGSMVGAIVVISGSSFLSGAISRARSAAWAGWRFPPTWGWVAPVEIRAGPPAHIEPRRHSGARDLRAGTSDAGGFGGVRSTGCCPIRCPPCANAPTSESPESRKPRQTPRSRSRPRRRPPRILLSGLPPSRASTPGWSSKRTSEWSATPRAARSTRAPPTAGRAR